MDKVFVVVDMSDGMGPKTVLRVFANYKDAVAYGNSLCDDGVIHEYDVHEREVYA